MASLGETFGNPWPTLKPVDLSAALHPFHPSSARCRPAFSNLDPRPWWRRNQLHGVASRRIRTSRDVTGRGKEKPNQVRGAQTRGQRRKRPPRSLARTHTRTHTRTHACTHESSNARTHARIYERTHACIHARVHTRKHARQMHS
jgi:hypothetical protein